MMLGQLALLVLFASAPTPKQEAPVPVRIPSSGGEVIIATPEEQREYDVFHYAAARRAGDTLYISGVVVSRREGEGKDVESFKAQVRRAFQRLEKTLAASGATFADVALVNTFHVWQSPDFDGDRDAQIVAFSAVKDEFMKAPHPAWTAVGTTGLLGTGSIIEIQLIAHVPRPARRAR
ncbi:RidA family protein [Archangium violaceum]|uniref:RidA family protein n=1 Tax=Archangium violaceum TaxID=83451 RepID=UPI002B27EEAB|nr:RidA family protein [Archangium gephyra]